MTELLKYSHSLIYPCKCEVADHFNRDYPIRVCDPNTKFFMKCMEYQYWRATDGSFRIRLIYYCPICERLKKKSIN